MTNSLLEKLNEFVNLYFDEHGKKHLGALNWKNIYFYLKRGVLFEATPEGAFLAWAVNKKEITPTSTPNIIKNDDDSDDNGDDADSNTKAVLMMLIAIMIVGMRDGVNIEKDDDDSEDRSLWFSTIYH